MAELRGYIEQLIGLELLRQTDQQYPVLVLTASGLALLKDEKGCPGLVLARQRVPRKGAPAQIGRAHV